MADEIPNQCRLPWILLSEKPFFNASKNDTTATATSKTGYLISVSFWMGHPPDLSLFSIDCSKPQNLQHRKHSNFKSMPRVVAADGPFVLLRVVFFCCRPEYFLYTAKDPPTLLPIPPPDEPGDFRARELGILRHRDGDNYLLADLLDPPSSEWDDVYQLRIYSSETESWSTRRLRNPCPGVDRVIPDKVITLGQGGLLGWVDLSLGLLVCNLLLLLEHQDQDPPVPGAVSFIPLPEPLHGNRYNLKCPIPPTQKWKSNSLEDKPVPSASWFRDLTCVNGVLKFVEMENSTPPENKDNIIYDSDLIMSLRHNDSKQQLLSFTSFWRAVIWTREVSSSSNSWCQTSCDGIDALRDVYSTFPIIRQDDDGDNTILYVKSVYELRRLDGQVSALDIGNMKLKGTGWYYLPHDFYYKPGHNCERPFRACTLSRHLNMTPGVQVSKCQRIIEDSHFANHPSETSIPTTAIQRQVSYSMWKLPLLHGYQNWLGKTSVHEMLLRVLYRMIIFPRSILLKTICHNDSSGMRPLGIPCGHIKTICHRSNASTRQMDPVALGMHRWPLYMVVTTTSPLWLPSKHQLTSSSEFKPHETPQACVASYHGYSQQLSAPNSFAYGAHTSYGNYQQQWLQLPPTAELPFLASWQHPPLPVQHQPTPLE